MRHKWLIGAIGGAGAILLALLLSVHVLARGVRGVESFAQAAESPAFGVVWAINTLIMLAFALFIAQTGREALRVLLTVALALLIGGLILLILNPQRAADAYTALLTGPLSRLNRWATWIDDAISLTLVALAITLVFKANLFSLGAEGQIFLGAMASGLVALFVEGLPTALHVSLAVGVGALVGLLWGLIPAVLRAYLGANELVATLMLNPIAALIYGFILERIRLPQSGIIASAFFPETALLPRLIPATRVTTAVLWVLIAALAVWWLMQRTPFGYALRAMGANPDFARYGGIRLERVIIGAMALSGLLSGLAGSYLALGIYQRLPLAVSTGLTFEAIVAALLARNNPLAVPAMALLYSYLRVGAPIMQNDAAVSLEIVRIIQALIILLFTAEGLLSLWQRRRAIAAWKAS
ncbi:MAG: ABC transporter permease [Candidatus Thermofonsia Clade 1 bacterium]|uniref:ABC transporter permease n=2 Tax=Candidatus Thermofonsia Clade 1 bacterium TaxID=2364210 RepID=A0A2M8P0Z2_9CHLR|nr:MAG: ABC transporter permease [Candidatus Thermofonsia Clade 1 bacterium]